MSSYLGLYIEENLIKYAKVSKDKEKTYIDAYGFKFYTDASKAIKQIIEETNSYKIPISTNLSEETYQYFTMSNLINKNDLNKAIKLEFESYCTEKEYDKDLFETRNIIVNDPIDKEKLKIVNIAGGKSELTRIEQKLKGYKVKTISPISIAIRDLLEDSKRENALVVNIEDITTITTILDGKIYSIDKLDFGSKEVIDKINSRENSYTKSYEICQNTTIYTMDSTDFSEEQSVGLEDIMPTLYNIVGSVQKIINESIETIDKVYITGTLSCVNNIDLYFQEYLEKVKCELLRPFFLQEMTEGINLKEYIEVNSAVALALYGLRKKGKYANFKKEKLGEELLSINIGKGGITAGNGRKIDINDFGEKLSKNELRSTRIAVTLLIFVLIFGTFSIMLSKQIEEKKGEVETLITKINSQITKVTSDTTSLNSKTTEYTALISDLQAANEKISDINSSKNLIPNLLNQIMSVIDETVQITSIENTTGKHIVINAQSPKYPGLGYFKTKLKTQNILQNVVSGSSVKQDGVITVTIEGDLP